MSEKTNSVYILSVEAKDLYDANHLLEPREQGYDVRSWDGGLNMSKFANTLDYSLDLIKLREVYKSAYRNRHFSFDHNGKEYTQTVINVTFNYSYSQFNPTIRRDKESKQKQTYYIKAGYPRNIEFEDCLSWDGETLVGVCVDAPISAPVKIELYDDTFFYDEESNTYKIYPSRNKPLKTCKELREDLYVNGFVCDGKKYVRFKRSSGSSRVGKCLFIDEKLAQRMFTWGKCGLTMRPNQNIDLAAWEAYISLTLSSIIDTIEIRPENILLIDDYESTFTDTMMAVESDDGWLTAEPKTMEISNKIWDGQALLDSSMFAKYPDKGMFLLRTRFFKAASFNTNLQKFFQDNGITEVSQLNGQTRAKRIEDVKLVITPSSLKFLKFGTFDQWLDKLEPQFGIVKYDKPTHFFGGRLVQTHYQLLNSLHMSEEEVKEFLEPSKTYFKQIDTDPTVYRYHIGNVVGELEAGDIKQFCFDKRVKNEICHYLLGHNNDFPKTKLYKTWKADSLSAFRSNLKRGHVLVQGTYATLFGNPYEMLQATIGQFEGESILGKDHIYCPMFEDGEDLVGSRSPHVAAGNILLTRNRKDRRLDEYFNLTRNIVCVNSIKENILERLSGADFDSDTMLITSDPMIVKKAAQHYEDFLVPTKLIPSQMHNRQLNNESRADLDYVTSTNKIGEIVNLSQELNSLIWDRLNKGAAFEEVEGIYRDVAKLDVLSNIEIDRAKREYEIDATRELAKMRKQYTELTEDGEKIKPYFFEFITKDKALPTDGKHYVKMLTTMDFLQKEVNTWRSKRQEQRKFVPLNEVFHLPYYSECRVRHAQAQEIFELIRETKANIKAFWKKYSEAKDLPAKQAILEEMDAMILNRIEYLTNGNYNPSTIFWMLKHIDDEEYADAKDVFFKLMFGHCSRNFRQFLKETDEAVSLLKYNKYGSKLLYGIPFDVVSSKASQ